MQRQPRFKCALHLRFVSELPCLVRKQFGVQVAHIRFADPRVDKTNPGLGVKPHDYWVVPLHPEEHAKQHSMNERKYWERVGIDPILYALRLWSVTGDYEQGCRVVMAATI